MNKKCFTAEQVLMLRENPYTYQVDQYRLAFTKEFKELFIRSIRQGRFLGRSWQNTATIPPFSVNAGYGVFPAISGSNTTNMVVSTKGLSILPGLNLPLCTLVCLHRKKTSSNSSGTKWIS